MSPLQITIVTWSITIVGSIAILGALTLGSIWLYVKVIEWFLAVTKLNEIFRKFMREEYMAERAKVKGRVKRI